MRRVTIALIAAAVLVAAGTAVAVTALTTLRSTSGGVPGFMAYRGLLTDAAGAPVEDGVYEVTFRLYEAPFVVDHVWEETRAVTTAGGYFNIFLGDVSPLSPELFQAGGMYLGIQVSGDREMQPRQRLGSVPFAMKAGDADTVGGRKPGDFAATPDPDVVQLRVGAGCPAGEAIREVERDGTVVCEPVTGAPTATPPAAPPPVPTPAPTATPAPEGPSPTPAPTATPQPTPTPSGPGFSVVAPGGGAVSQSDLCDVQRLMAATVPGYSAGIECVPRSTAVVDRGSSVSVCASYVESTGQCTQSGPGMSSVGSGVSVQVGDDGIPVMAYEDTDLDQLRFARCQDARCSGADIHTVDTISDEGGFPSLALRSDGRAVISYTHTQMVFRQSSSGLPGGPLIALPQAGDVLKVALCADALCSSSTKVVVDDGSDRWDTGYYTSIALLPGDAPAISYQSGPGDLMYSRCLDAACSGVATALLEAASGGPSGLDTSIAIGANGAPVVAYHKQIDVPSLPGTPSSKGLKIALCQDAACAVTEQYLVEQMDGDRLFPSLAIDPQGRPVIAYRDPVGLDLKVAGCLRPDCAPQVISDPLSPIELFGQFKVHVVDDDGATGWRPSLGFGSDGLPVIAYGDRTNSALRLATCDTEFCSAGAVSTLDPTLNASAGSALATTSDGVPVIAYALVTIQEVPAPVPGGRSYVPHSQLKLFHCGNPRCLDVGQ